MPVDPERARSLFLAAVDLSPADRGPFLDRECGASAALRARVESLIAAHEVPTVAPVAGTALPDGAAHEALTVRSAGAPRESSPDANTLLSPHPTAAGNYVPSSGPATVIAGRYTLAEKIGEGGMGAVYRATQTEPVKRQVALKLIKWGTDSKAVLARFDAERQALALMDHPSIARIYDGGVTPTGQPFFAMELVAGAPITEYCDARRLTVDARLRLFVRVCQAVQHAHQKGIIHRDLKPGNVLVTEVDGRPTPKVIDFGVAKATEQKLTALSLAETGAIVGTPAYMSPEQADPTSADVDTRADVYALGVVLYELLAGAQPIDAAQFERGAVLELLRLVREVEPPRPSARLSTVAALPSIAARRGTDPTKLAKLLQGELDWVVMKSLEKDRGRRYESAAAFARDVERYLANEVVEARPPSTGYRLRKFAARNRGPVLAGGLVLLVLVAGVVGTTLGLLEARRQADLARQEAGAKELARAEEERQRGIADGQRAAAERAEARTADVLDAMVSESTGNSLAAQKKIGTSQKAFLTEVLPYYREFAASRGDDVKTRVRVARAAYRVGLIESRLGRIEEGIAAFESARDSYAKLAAEFPTGLEHRADLASSYDGLGFLRSSLGEWAAAEEQYRKGLVLRTKLAAEFPAEPELRANLARSHVNVGNASADLGRGAGAEEEYKKGIAILVKLGAEFPAEPEYRQLLAGSHYSLGILLSGVGNATGAEEQYKKVLVLRAGLVAEFPAVPELRADLARCHVNLGNASADLGRSADAEEQYRKGLALQEKLVAEFPAEPAYRIDLGGVYCNLGNRSRWDGHVNESLGWYEKSIATLAPIHRAAPRDVTAKRVLRNCHENRARAYDYLRRYTDAVKDWDRTVELSPPDEQPRFRARRATSRSCAGAVTDAVAEVAELTKSPNWDSDEWYDFACVYANAGGKIADKKSEYADRAMELLKTAVKAGWEDAAHIRRDTDLDPLRARADFKELLADLEERFPLPVAPAPRTKP